MSREVLCGLQCRTIRLSLPSPPRDFAQHWSVPGSLRCYTLAKKHKFLRVTAATGVLANLKAALAATGCIPTAAVFEAAAGAGHEDICVWLLEQHCPVGNALTEAARAGHSQVCEVLLLFASSTHRTGAAHDKLEPQDAARTAACAAARGGHDGFMRSRSMQAVMRHCQLGPVSVYHLLPAVAEGCDLASVQRTWKQRPDMMDLTGWRAPAAGRAASMALAAAVGSPTPDWREKAEWLEEQGCTLEARYDNAAGERAAALPDHGESVHRLVWLHERSYPFREDTVHAAVRAGNAEAIKWMLREGVFGTGGDVEGRVMGWVLRKAIELRDIQVLRALGTPISSRWIGHIVPSRRRYSGLMSAAFAAEEPLPALVWLLGALEAGGAVAEELLAEVPLDEAARSGSVELLAWLAERGCALLTPAVFAGAAAGGSEEVLEWLVERGCDMGKDGEPYVRAARNGDFATMATLRRLGCPWGADGRTFKQCDNEAMPEHFRLKVLVWLRKEGCPSPWDAAFRVASLRPYRAW